MDRYQVAGAVAALNVIPNISLAQYRSVVGTFNGYFSTNKKTCDRKIFENRMYKKYFKWTLLTVVLYFTLVSKVISSVNVAKIISNKEMHIYNGNREKCIKIAHWNKGNSLLVTKMSEIRSIADQHKPVIIGISEANFSEDYDEEFSPNSKLQFIGWAKG